MRIGDAIYEDDSSLITRFIRGDVDACAELYNRYVDSLYSYGHSLMNDEAQLKDMIQDVFQKFLVHPELLSNVKNLKFYLFKALKNRIFDLKKSKCQRDLDRNELSEDCEMSTFTIHDVTILDDIIEQEEVDAIGAQVKDLLDLMTPRQRAAVSLRYFHDMDYEEIAELLNMTNAKSARNLVSRAIRHKLA